MDSTGQINEGREMSNFKRAFDFTLKDEGNYSDHPNDRGGPTNWGITIGVLSRWRCFPVSKEDVENLTVEEAMKIYNRWYWLPLDLDYVEDQGVACAIFNMGVNRGISTIAKVVQRLVGVTVDGHVGPKTLRAINDHDPKELIQKISDQAKQAYARIIERNSSQAVFRKGWMNRADRLLELKEWA